MILGSVLVFYFHRWLFFNARKSEREKKNKLKSNRNKNKIHGMVHNRKLVVFLYSLVYCPVFFFFLFRCVWVCVYMSRSSSIIRVAHEFIDHIHSDALRFCFVLFVAGVRFNFSFVSLILFRYFSCIKSERKMFSDNVA